MFVRTTVAGALVAGALVAVPYAQATPQWEPRKPTYPAVVIDSGVPVTMSDGRVVYADVYLPSKDGKNPVRGRFPTLLLITPYGKTGAATPTALTPQYAVPRGYAYVIAESRGTGESQGTWDFGSDREQRDGYDTVEWAAHQRWSTGNVGLVGDSYKGFDQWWAAMQQPPNLKAISPINAPADMYRTGGVNGGELSSLTLAQGLVLGFGVAPGSYAASDPRQAVAVASGHAGGAVVTGTGTVDIADGGTQSYDSRYYHHRSGYWNADRITVPTLLIDGWYDIAQRDAPLMFSELQRRRVPVGLVMGPWFHTGYGAGLPAPGMPYTLPEIILRWMDHYVAGRPDPTLKSFGPVVYETDGTGRYSSAPTWPPPGVTPRSFYLAGSAVPGVPGTLATSPPRTSGAPDRLPWQPVSGACSRSTAQALLGIPSSVPDEPCERNGAPNDATGLAYDLPVGPHGLRLSGPIAAHLYVSTTGSDAFADVRVEDVAPDGTVAALTDGIDTLSFRALDRRRTLRLDGHIVRPFHPYTKASARPAHPGTIYGWWIEVRPDAAYLAPGHTLRVTVQPASAGQSVMSENRLTGMAGSVLSIYHDKAHPSAIVIPVANS